MYLKYLKISTPNKLIRKINFRLGINLIVDESEESITGNSVGKTTVLKLIDFCLGAKNKSIWQDAEDAKKVDEVVKNFLIDKKVLITLSLTSDLNDPKAKEVIIERNFLSTPSKVIRNINGTKYLDADFENKLKEALFPSIDSPKPTIRQIISHNIRYKDQSISQTLRTLDKYTSDPEYECLHLFMLGCSFDDAQQRQNLIEKTNQENTYKNRLERIQTKSAYELALAAINSNIESLELEKSQLNINEDFDQDLDELNNLKYEVNKRSTEISKLKIRRDLIIEANDSLNNSISKIDLDQLNQIYEQFTNLTNEVHKSFEDLVNYHNQMIVEKQKYITRELPSLNELITENEEQLQELLSTEKVLSQKVKESVSYIDLERIISQLNEKYRQKGEYESVLSQLEEVYGNIESYSKQMDEIDENLFSDDFEKKVKTQLEKFNKFFSSVSETLYGEQYLLKYDIVKYKKDRQLYKFSSFNANFSSGKKQGEISCFDIAYIQFADAEKIETMHFLLNDKKELMHDNQLVKIAELVNELGIQFVASILKDKLPAQLNKEAYFIVKLSEDDKLFRIESFEDSDD